MEFKKWLLKLYKVFIIQDGWIHVRGFANSPIIKLTILMPVFGYTILFSDKLSSYFELSPELVDNSIYGVEINENSKNAKLTPQTKFRLYSFYFGLSLIGFGSLVYAFYCPSIIKKYESINAMTSDHIETIDPGVAIWYFDAYIRDSKVYKDHNKADVLIKLEDAVKEYHESDTDVSFRKSVKEILRDVWTQENFSKSKTLHFTSLLFKLGFVTLAIPTIELFMNVIFTLF